MGDLAGEIGLPGSALHLRRPGAAPRAVVSALLCCLACAPAAPPAEEDPAKRRIAELGSQIEAGRAGLPVWRRWYEELATRNQQSFEHEGFFLGRNSERLLYDEPLLDQLLGEESGPLATILHFARQLEESGIDLLMLPVPPRSATHPGRLGIVTPLARGEEPPPLDWRLRELYLTLEDSGVEVVDLLPHFLAAPTRDPLDPPPGGPPAFREEVFSRQDTHWTSYGAELAGRVLGERVRRYPWFAESARRQGRAELLEKTEWAWRRGAIARLMVARNELAPDFPKEPLLVHRVSVRGERWSFSDKDAPVLLMGDSFASPSRGLPDELLAQLGYRIDLVYVPGGSRSSHLKALRLRGDGLAGKRLVIWEFATHTLHHPERWMPIDVLTPAPSEPSVADEEATG